MKKVTWKQWAPVLAVLAVAIVLPSLGMAQPGQNVLEDFMASLQGGYGTAAGLGVALFGLYMWIIKQATWGIMVIVGGVILTSSPSFYEAISGGLGDVLSNSVDGYEETTIDAN
jgi:type IV secretory pathway VirB2 component (pilin)